MKILILVFKSNKRKRKRSSNFSKNFRYNSNVNLLESLKEVKILEDNRKLMFESRLLLYTDRVRGSSIH